MPSKAMTNRGNERGAKGGAIMIRAKMQAALPPEWQARLKQERQQAIKAAANFVRMCADGDADKLYNEHLHLNECSPDAWRLAMGKVARLPRVSREIRQAFLNIWIESKMLPLRVGHRPTMAAALRVLMPSGDCSIPLMLYRGAGSNERRRRLYGFSWTTDLAIALSFAEHWSMPAFHSRGVVLQTVAPSDAILLMRQPEDYYDEGEVVVDPFRLGKIWVAETAKPGLISPLPRYPRGSG